jgi:hypothetical protein
MLEVFAIFMNEGRGVGGGKSVSSVAVSEVGGHHGSAIATDT